MISNGPLDGDPYNVVPFQQVKQKKMNFCFFKVLMFREEHS